MAVHKIKNSRDNTVTADKANDTWIVTGTGKIETATTGIDAGGPAKGREIVVEGLVSGATYGIVFGDVSGKGAGLLEIAKGGVVESPEAAVLSRADGQEIVNKGMIRGDLNGIVSFGDKLDVVNNGKIDVGNGAIDIQQGSAEIVNNGRIFAESGVYGGGSGDGRIVVVNNGLIETTKTSVDLQGSGNHRIVNTGEITAGIASGDGNDRFINDGGKVGGTVNLKDGNDTYVIDRSSIIVDESSYDGKDTVRASVDYEIGAGIEKLVLTGTANIDATGNSEANRLIGNSGNNRLDGWGGADMLKGAGGSDVFVFSYHGGHDEIVDFNAGTDRIDMRGWEGNGFDNFKDVKDNATQMGDDLLISNGGSDDLLIHDFNKADLHKADFIF